MPVNAAYNEFETKISDRYNTDKMCASERRNHKKGMTNAQLIIISKKKMNKTINTLPAN